MNSWRIPEWPEEEVRARDRTCVYCRIEMTEGSPRRGPRKATATWEHIINDATIVTSRATAERSASRKTLLRK